MDFWIYWIALGAIFIIMEMFLGTLDFLAVGIAGILTGILVKLLHLDMTDWKIAGIIFLIASVVAILITRLLILPKMQGGEGPEPLSADKIVGLQMTVEEINKRLVVKYEGNYWNIVSDEDIHPGDTVTVVKMKDNKLEVTKA